MRAIEHFEHTVSWARAHERHLSAISLAGGFAFDSYAFGRIDRPMTQAVFIIYLVVAGAAIAVLHALESRPDNKKPSGRTHTILVTVAQFALGCLLSGFCVFYIRSAAIGASWPFLLCMAGIFIGNEYLRRYHARLVFSALLFFFSLYSYAILLVPVVIARIGTVPFLISGGIAVAVFFFYMQTLAVLGHDRYRVARMQIAAGMIGITALINAFYFVKIFPPLPLVLSDAGVYHAIQRSGRDYQVTAEDEPPRWRALFGTFAVEHIQPNDKLYLYSAIFAPYRLTTNIVHNWEWRDPRSGHWVQQQTVRFTIHGGREDGFRAYSSKTAPRPGQWRVNIATADGHAIGRVRFSVETQAVPPAVSVKTLK
jgi:MFS family permease